MMSSNIVLSLLFRQKDVDYSMEKVFKPLIPFFKKSIKVEECYMPYYNLSPKSVICNLKHTYLHRKNVNHITGMIHYVSLVLPSKSTIVTIHDIFAYCQGSWLKQKLLRFFCLVLPAWKAGYLTCISETTRQNVLKYCPWADKKIRVIYNPIDEQYVSFTREFNQSRPVILHIGTRENKNLERVIKSLEGIQCLLVIIGVLSEEQKILLVDCHIDYINKYRLTDDEILEEYKGCDIVSFPSLKEGFGMPIIEGQAIGRPVLTSNRPPMTEVGADSVYYVNPEDVNSIKEGFQKLIANSELRTELIEKGTDNVNRFRAETIAAQYIELYKEALA